MFIIKVDFLFYDQFLYCLPFILEIHFLFQDRFFWLLAIFICCSMLPPKSITYVANLFSRDTAEINIRYWLNSVFFYDYVRSASSKIEMTVFQVFQYRIDKVAFSQKPILVENGKIGKTQQCVMHLIGHAIYPIPYFTNIVSYMYEYEVIAIIYC